jgi:hypothetical protein
MRPQTNMVAPTITKIADDGSGTTTMPTGPSIPEMRKLFTLTPAVVYSKMLLL